jgi:general secretion pathway protein G
MTRARPEYHTRTAAVGPRRHARRGSRGETGFTIIEILVVVLIIGIVASIALVALFSAFDKARQRGTMTDMRTISKAIEIYMVDHEVPPSDAGGMASLASVLIPYESSVIPVADQWRNGYRYTADLATRSYTIESFGKDGVDGANITTADRFDYELDIVLANGVFVASPE